MARDGLLLRIRPAHASDLAAMEWEGEYRRFRRLYQHAFAESQKGRYLILLAEIGDQVVGQVLIRLGADAHGSGREVQKAYMHAVRVRPEHRNQGVGTRLIQEAETAMQRGHCGQVALSVAKDNEAARRLYERLGYTVVGEDPGEWSFIDDEGQTQHISEPSYILEKSL